MVSSDLDRLKTQEYRKHGKVDYKLFAKQTDLGRKTGWARCPMCSRDVSKAEIFAAGQIVVGEKTFIKLWQMFKETGTRFEMTKREVVNYPLVFVLDEITLKPITGLASYVEMDICRSCLAKMGQRHKFAKYRQKQAFINQAV